MLFGDYFIGSVDPRLREDDQSRVIPNLIRDRRSHCGSRTNREDAIFRDDQIAKLLRR